MIAVSCIMSFTIYQGFVSLYVLAPWTVPWTGDIIIPNPPKPEITYGEFPFQLIYELNGETKVIEDAVICEFDGVDSRGESGKYRKWKTRLKSGNEHLVILDVSELEEEDDFGHKVLKLFFYYGNGEYYMGDDAYRAREGQSLDYVSYMYQNTDGEIGYSIILPDAAWSKYKIKLISWKPSPPIQNSFK